MEYIENSTRQAFETDDEAFFELDDFKYFQYTLVDIQLAAFVASVVLNIAVLFCAVKLFKGNDDPVHLFIASMTCGDLLLTGFALPSYVLSVKYPVLDGEAFCAIKHWSSWLGFAISALSLVLLNIDKFIYFQWPLHYDHIISNMMAFGLCAFIWIMSVGFVSCVWFRGIMDEGLTCVDKTPLDIRVTYNAYMVLFSILPVTSSAVVSVYLFRLTREKRRLSACLHPNINAHVLASKMKSLVFTFATTAWTVCSLLPYRIFHLYRVNIAENDLALNCYHCIVFLHLLYLSPVINPIITAVIYAPYRLLVKKHFVNIPIRNPTYLIGRRTNQTDTSNITSIFIDSPSQFLQLRQRTPG